MHPELHSLHRQLIITTIETRQHMSTLAVENSMIALQETCPPNALNPEAWHRKNK